MNGGKLFAKYSGGTFCSIVHMSSTVILPLMEKIKNKHFRIEGQTWSHLFCSLWLLKLVDSLILCSIISFWRLIEFLFTLEWNLQACCIFSKTVFDFMLILSSVTFFHKIVGFFLNYKLCNILITSLYTGNNRCSRNELKHCFTFVLLHLECSRKLLPSFEYI